LVFPQLHTWNKTDTFKYNNHRNNNNGLMHLRKWPLYRFYLWLLTCKPLVFTPTTKAFYASRNNALSMHVT
jgi:hypothetical protein